MGKIGPKVRFFVIFLKFGPLVFLEIAQEDSLEHCLTTSKGKTHGKNFGRPKLYPKLGFLSSFRVASLYFLDIAQDCRLGQCLTSNRTEPPKTFCGRNWGRNDLFYCNVVERPLKCVCFSTNLSHSNS